MSVSMQTVAAGCENSQPLVSGSDPVPDSAFTASSTWVDDVGFGPEKSRITSSGGWADIWHPAGGQYDGAWIQVSYINVLFLYYVYYFLVANKV